MWQGIVVLKLFTSGMLGPYRQCSVEAEASAAPAEPRPGKTALFTSSELPTATKFAENATQKIVCYASTQLPQMLRNFFFF